MKTYLPDSWIKLASEARFLGVLAIILFLSNQYLIAQTTDGCVPPTNNLSTDPWSPECYFEANCVLGNVCTANDVTVNRIYVADINGNPVNPACPANTAVYLFAEMSNNTGTSRYAVQAYFEVYMDGDYIESRSECFGTINPGITQLKLDTQPIIINCEASYTIGKVWLGWTTTPNDNCSNATTCKSYSSSKCSKDLTNYYSIVVPSITYDCGNYDENSITVTFTGTPLGGVAPYTYAWDFNGDGTIDATTQNPTYTFNTTSTGDFTVSLKITDFEGAYGTAVLDLQLPRITNCSAGPIIRCEYDAPIDLATTPGFIGVNGKNGDYFIEGGGPAITTFDPKTYGPGTYNLYFIYSDINGCSDICNFTHYYPTNM